MKYRIIIALLILVAVAAGCSKSDTPNPPMPDGYTPSTTPIVIQTSDNWDDVDDAKAQTRGVLTESRNFTSFATFAYLLPSTNNTAAEWNEDATPNFMYNQKISRKKLDDGSFEPWEYSPIKYWSDNENDRIRFFACAPHKCQGVEPSGNTEGGAPRFTVTPRNRVHYHQDFMTAKALLKSKSDNEVKFEFEHKLAQAKIYAAHKGAESDTVRILSVAISGLRESGTLVYNETAEEYQWEHLQPGYSEEAVPTTTYNLIAAAEEPNEFRTDSSGNLKHLASATKDISKYTDPSLDKGQAYMYLVPQNNIEKIDFVVFFEYIEFVDENTKNVTQTFQEFTLSGSSLKEGETKAYLLLIDPTTIGFGDITTTVEPWTDKTVSNGNDNWMVE